MSDKEGGEWLTWDEAGEWLGIKPDSVRRRARARHWPRQQGNDGKARVKVPPEAIPDNRPAIIPDEPPADTPETLARLAVAEALLEDALRQIDDVRQDRDAWREQAQRLAGRSVWSRLFNRPE